MKLLFLLLWTAADPSEIVGPKAGIFFWTDKTTRKQDGTTPRAILIVC
jgi:hypothetical protein